MRLFLVRHGETVDNVAGLYAGSRDSPLTSHGVLQTRRLGAHFAAAHVPVVGPVTHIFASDLQRAAHTAEAILEAHPRIDGSCTDTGVVRLRELRERDFGSAEGMKYMAQPQGDPHPDAESYASMDARIGRFVEQRLRPLVETGLGRLNVVVVGHGIILNVLLRAILQQYAPHELVRLSGSSAGGKRVEWLASFHNTAYLEAQFTQPPQTASLGQGPSPSSEAVYDRGPAVQLQGDVIPKGSDAADYCMTILAVNSREHLEGLKKTGGGIGSAKFDEKQKTVDSFFKPVPKA